MTKRYVWKLFKNGELREIEIHSPRYIDYKLEEGPFDSIEEAEAELECYFKKYNEYYKQYGLTCNEEFVLLSIYSS